MLYLKKNLPELLTNKRQLKFELIYIQNEAISDHIEAWVDVTEDWMVDLLQTKLSENFSFGDVFHLPNIHEFEFIFSVPNLINSNLINQLLNRYRQSELSYQIPSKLNFQELTGMLKGFVDLIFIHDNRYYIIDYKTNHLGNNFESYQEIPLQKAINQHYYDMQYLIYTVALTRYLKLRIPNFDYERDFGGIYYLFIRGMHQNSNDGIFFSKPNIAIINELNRIFDNQFKG